MDLIILAGGKGSRFGGPKQIEKIDEYGDFLMDYAIYNAIKVGFEKIIFITNEECNDVIFEKYNKLLKGVVDFECVVQDNKSLFDKFNIKRDKPLGTGLSLICAKKYIKDGFCVVNADDFYGYNSFAVAIDYLKNLKSDSDEYALVGYKLASTLSEQGAVKRGVCEIKNGNYLDCLHESVVNRENGKLVATELDTGKQLQVEDDTIVSMNMFCLNKKMVEHIEHNFKEFISNRDNLQNGEFLISVEIEKILKQNNYSMKILPTNDKWIGLTYREDWDMVSRKLSEFVKNGEYPKNVCQNFALAKKVIKQGENDLTC